MGFNIAIAGAGQLGSRHLQGLAKYEQPLSIWVYDISASSLKTARLRWEECNYDIHAINYCNDLKQLPSKLDLTIVASNADIRPSLVKNICSVSKVKYWVLEKILAQSKSGLKDIETFIGKDSFAWVNTPMYYWPLYKKIKEYYLQGIPISAKFTGFDGLACNAIHYIDFVVRWNKTEVSEVDITGLSSNWHESKRSGFFEIYGKLIVKFKDGSCLFLSSHEKQVNYKVKLIIGDDIWNVYESEGYAENNKGEKIFGNILFQSQLTGLIAKQILEDGICNLPSLDTSVKEHELIIQALSEHWNVHMPNNINYLPIT